jgi:hypothetical protein
MESMKKPKQGRPQRRRHNGVLSKDSRAIADTALELGEKCVIYIKFSDLKGVHRGRFARLCHGFLPSPGCCLTSERCVSKICQSSSRTSHRQGKAHVLSLFERVCGISMRCQLLVLACSQSQLLDILCWKFMLIQNTYKPIETHTCRENKSCSVLNKPRNHMSWEYMLLYWLGQPTWAAEIMPEFLLCTPNRGTRSFHVLRWFYHPQAAASIFSCGQAQIARSQTPHLDLAWLRCQGGLRFGAGQNNLNVWTSRQIDVM